MKVVVIGATGNVGMALTRALSIHPNVDEVIGIARRTPSGGLPNVRWLEADIVTDDLVTVFRGADVVVHLAWLIQPTRDAQRLWDVNVGGSMRVLTAVEAAGVGAFVYASSVGAYSPGPSDERVEESWPTNGVATSAYSREKAYTERALDAFEARNPGTRVVRMRPALIFSEEPATHLRRVFLGSLVPHQLVRPDALPVIPRIRGLSFQAVHTADVADAYLRAIVGDASGPFNIAAEPVFTPEVLAEEFGARLLPVPRRVVRGAVSVTWRARLQPIDAGWIDLATSSPLLDSRRAHRELGWWPTRSGTDALREMLRGMRSGRGGPSPVLEAEDERSRVDELKTGQGARETTDERTATRAR